MASNHVMTSAVLRHSERCQRGIAWYRMQLLHSGALRSPLTFAGDRSPVPGWRDAFDPYGEKARCLLRSLLG